jgi:predicted O-methyltransferase YrrM
MSETRLTTHEVPEFETYLDDMTAELICYLGSVGLFGGRAGVFSREAFHTLTANIQQNFRVPQTSITTAAARLFFAIAESLKPGLIVGLGTYYGNGLVWFLGPYLSDPDKYGRCRALACDLDPRAVDTSCANFHRIGLSAAVRIDLEDASVLLHQVDGPIDLLFIDVDHPSERKAIYAPLLRLALDKLAPGGLVVAHDRYEPAFAADFASYLELVNDRQYFDLSVGVPVDRAGVEVSRRC